MLVSNLATATEFYRNVLGISLSDKRPDFDFDGAWFQLEGQQIHLICVDAASSSNDLNRRCGRDQHIALVVEDLKTLTNRLTNAGIKYEKSRSGRPAIFCRDPDGNALEFVG